MSAPSRKYPGTTLPNPERYPVRHIYVGEDGHAVISYGPEGGVRSSSYCPGTREELDDYMKETLEALGKHVIGDGSDNFIDDRVEMEELVRDVHQKTLENSREKARNKGMTYIPGIGAVACTHEKPIPDVMIYVNAVPTHDEDGKRRYFGRATLLVHGKGYVHVTETNQSAISNAAIYLPIVWALTKLKEVQENMPRVHIISDSSVLVNHLSNGPIPRNNVMQNVSAKEVLTAILGGVAEMSFFEKKRNKRDRNFVGEPWFIFAGATRVEQNKVRMEMTLREEENHPLMGEQLKALKVIVQ